ncbi:MAG: YCF48-related protein, partial [Bacteroidota bacterium]|nr:YCF48-related protein [Bacteroidota bacterium]
MKYKLAFFVLLISSIGFTAEWKWQNPLPQGNNLWKISFYNEWYGYAVGEYGTIMFTSNKGATWEIQYEGITDNFRDICVKDSVTAWIAGDNGTIIYTTNNGATWIDQTSFSQNGLNSIYFYDKLNGWAGGDERTILKTTNGGATWTKISTMSVPLGTSINSIYFTSLNNGWATCSNGYILKTIDAGITWSLQFNTTQAGFNIKFYNTSLGFVVGMNGSIYSTTNSGANWTKIPSGTTQGLNDIFFASSTEFLIAGHNGTILRSTNSGASWFSESIPTYASVHGITRVNTTTFIVGEYGLLGYKNGTSNWIYNNIGMNKSINWVTFSNHLRGFAVGQYGKISRTSDGGSTWVEINNGVTGDSFYGAELIDSNYVWAVGDGGVILHSSNGGSSWIQQTTNTFNSLLSISFINRNQGWVVGDVGEFFYTTNAGNSWIKRSTGWANIFFGVKFKDANNGWIVGDGGLVLRTTNGGSSWVRQTSNTLETIFYVDFFDINNGYCAGTNGLILKTTNGGLNWEKLTTGTTRNIYIASGISHNSVWAIGDSGLVLHSTNGGLNWISEFPKTGYDLFGLKVISDSKAWICGDNGTILTRDTIVPISSISVSYDNGWNLISNPVSRAIGTDSAKILFPNLLTNYVFEFGESGYAAQPILINGKGYWGKFNAPGISYINGTYITSDTIDVKQGWNLIGSISYDVLTSTVISVPTVLINSLWYGYSSGYYAATYIVPGKGYWVKCNEAGKLVMFSNIMQKYSSSIDVASNYLDGFNSLTISDADGNSQKLFFGLKLQTDFNTEFYELPPTSNFSVFDARFINDGKGYILHTLNTDLKENYPAFIKIASTKYPLTISWDVRNNSNVESESFLYNLSDGTNDKPIELTGNGKITVTNKTISSLILNSHKGKNLPTEFSLYQNYPNPFNPFTIIKYDLPVESYVTISVYNAIGQRVTLLVAEKKEAGNHQIKFGGSSATNIGGLPSGIYFYRIEATGISDPNKSFLQVRKML